MIQLMRNIFSILLLVTLPCWAVGYWYEPGTMTHYVPGGTSASWSSNAALADAWSYHEHMTQVNSYVTVNTDYNHGGVIYKFTSSVPVALSLDISALVSLHNWSGRKATLYFSDNDNWEDLNSPLDGSRYGGWSPDFESNANWIRLTSYQEWGGSGSQTLSGADLVTLNGTFYLRVDISQVGAPLQSIRFNELSWVGEVITPSASAVVVWESDGATQVSEAGVTDTYQLSLSGSPSGSVMVEVDPDEQLGVNGLAAGAVYTAVFDPPNYLPVTITVAGADDETHESLLPETHVGRISHHVAAGSDGNYLGLGVDDVVVSIIDNDRFCGDAGTEYLPADMNYDCYVDLRDFAILAQVWLGCNEPQVPGCDVNWP